MDRANQFSAELRDLRTPETEFLYAIGPAGVDKLDLLSAQVIFVGINSTIPENSQAYGECGVFHFDVFNKDRVESPYRRNATRILRDAVPGGVAICTNMYRKVSARVSGLRGNKTLLPLPWLFSYFPNAVVVVCGATAQRAYTKLRALNSALPEFVPCPVHLSGVPGQTAGKGSVKDAFAKLTADLRVRLS
jgi:hypothetical protein